MAIRRSRSVLSKKRKNRQELLSSLHRKPRRDMHIERLEDRQLLAGAQLIGIQPNDGALLQTGDIRNVAPADLTFRFDQNQVIDPASLGSSTAAGGIQITRANLDGLFAPATVSSDFGTGANGVLIEFSAVRLGDDQNGITLSISKSNFGGAGLPGVSVIGRTINISLNVNSNNQSTALDLVNAMNNSAEASNLVSARIVRGSPSQNIAATAAANTSLVLAGANDVVVRPGYIGVGAEPALNEVVFRFAGQVPDDVYRIDIFGTGATPLKNTSGETYLDGKNSAVVFELDLAPQVVSVVPQPILRLANGSLAQERNKVAVYFNNDDLDLATVQNTKFYQLIYTNETLENTDDLVFNPNNVQYSADKDMAILTFASDLATLAPLGSGTFRLRIGTDEVPAASTPNPTPAPPIVVTPEARNQGTYNNVPVDFLGLAEQWGQATRIEVIESDFGFDSLPKVSVLDNVITVELNAYTASGNIYSPTTAQQMVDAINAHFIAGQQVLASVDPVLGATVITTGTAHAPVTLVGLGSSYSTASNLGTLTEQNQIVRGLIEPQVYRLELPGSNDEPGHRETPVVQHLSDGSADKDTGITRVEYNFRSDIGVISDSLGNAQSAFNIITETQKRRAREAVQVLSDLIGVEFVETERDGLIIASGDTRAVNPNQPLLVMSVDLNDRFNGSWFRTAMSGITGLLGLGSAPELPGLAIGDLDTNTATAGYEVRASDSALDFGNPLEPTVMSDQDLVHLRHLYFPESKDIDLFRFELAALPGRPDADGRLTIETMAERQLQSSLLDTVLTLWRAKPDGSYELLARNDNYFGRDSYLELDLGPGVYYVGISASGNDEYDPIIEDSGFGGTTQGEYELRLNYRPDAAKAISDADNPNNAPTFLDGDGDGVPGGVYNFWFKAAPVLQSGPPTTAAETIFVDKSYVPPSGTTPSGTLNAPYNNLATALQQGRRGGHRPHRGQCGPGREIEHLAGQPSLPDWFQQPGGRVAGRFDAGDSPRRYDDGRRGRRVPDAPRPHRRGQQFGRHRPQRRSDASSGRADPADGQQRQRQLRHQRRRGAKYQRHAGRRQRVFYLVQRPDDRPGHEPVHHHAGQRRLGRPRVPQRRGPHARLLPVGGRRHLPELRQSCRHPLRRRHAC